MNDPKRQKQLVFLLLSLFLPLFLGACSLSNFFSRYNSFASRSAADNQKRIEVIRRSSSTFSGNTCSEETRGHDCYRSCEKMYSYGSEKRECYGLTVQQIEKIKEVYDILDKSRERDLEKISLEAFELYLNFSIRSMNKLAEGLNKSQAKNLIVWLISYEDIAQIFKDLDEDYKILNNILQNIIAFETVDIDKPFSQTVRSSDTIMDVIVAQRYYDGLVLEWMMDFIEDSPNCETDTATTSCLTVYCKIGKAMNDTKQERLLKNDPFKNFIDNILEEKVNSSNWNLPTGTSLDDLENSGDLEDSWVDALCDTLI